MEKCKFEYSDSVIHDNVVRQLTVTGISIEDYLDKFGYPEEIEEMKVDSKWFCPPLPGFEDTTDYVVTMGGAEAVLAQKKYDAFMKYAEEKGLLTDYDSIKLNKQQADSLLSDDFRLIEDCWYTQAQMLREDLESFLEENLQISGNEYELEGVNMNWRGSSGELDDIIMDNGAQDVLNMFRSYGDYSMDIEGDKDKFEITISHHDGTSRFIFTKKDDQTG